MGYSPWCRKELDTTERLHFHFQSDLKSLHALNSHLLGASNVQSPLLETQRWTRHRRSFQGGKDTREGLAKVNHSARLKVLNAMKVKK